MSLTPEPMIKILIPTTSDITNTYQAHIQFHRKQTQIHNTPLGIYPKVPTSLLSAQLRNFPRTPLTFEHQISNSPPKLELGINIIIISASQNNLVVHRDRLKLNNLVSSQCAVIKLYDCTI